MGIENNIPEDWIETTLDKICSKVTDGSHQSPKSFNGGLPMLSVKDMRGLGFDIENSKKISASDFNKLAKQGCKPEINDVLIAKDGSVLKHMFLVKEEINAVLLSSIAIVRPIVQKISPSFLVYTLINPRFKKYILNNFLSGSGVPRIVLKDFKKIELLLPPLPEQKAIAKVLTAFDDKIELLQAQNKTLESMAQTIFKEWFGKYQIGDELPEGWSVGKLGNEFDITIGRTPPRKETQWFSDRPTGKKWISIKDIGNCGTFIYNTSEYLTDEAIEKFNIPIIPTNTTILSFKMTVGKLTITTEDMLSNEAIAHLKIKNDSTLTSEFIYLFLRDLNFNSLGSTSSIVTAINSTIIKGIDFIIPKDELMNRFQKKILPIFKKIQNNSSQIQSLTKTRDTLLPKLMSGQVRVNNIKQTADA